jgi:hypothetical protein
MPLDWSTPYTNLDAALAALASYPSAPGVIVGTAALARLGAVGAAYDVDYAEALGRLGDWESDYTAAVGTWSTAVSPIWIRAVNVCRYLEQKQRLAQTGLVLVPQAITNAAGTPILLTEDAPALPSLPEPTTLVRASRTLLSGSTPILRVTALDDGTPGNLVSVAVSNATDGNAAHFKLTVSKGSGASKYSEVYDNLDASSSTPLLGSQSGSLLIETLAHAGLGRPDNLAATPLTGGLGGAYDALLRRIGDLRELQGIDADFAALTTVDIATLDEARAQLEGVWGTAPASRDPIAQRASELQTAIDDAEEITAFLTSGLA